MLLRRVTCKQCCQNVSDTVDLLLKTWLRRRTTVSEPSCNTSIDEPHIPVLLEESLSQLKLAPGNTLLDMTFGAGGHSLAALKSVPNIKILALDRDPVAYRYAQDLAQSFPEQVIPLHGKFSDLPQLLKEHDINKNSIDGILFDLGCSSMQFDEGSRGFAISKNGPLDMRMNPQESDSITAAQVIAHANEVDLWRIFKIYGEEKNCKKIARAIVESRFSIQPITTTEQLAKLVEMVVGFSYRADKLQRKAHIATKIFQALRIFVNNEINELNYGLLLAHHYLRFGGRLAVISFHSLEDTIAKRHLCGNVVDNAVNSLPLKYSSSSLSFNEHDMLQFRDNTWEVLTKQVVVPSSDEVTRNPRSRSAKLRAAIKIK